MSVDFSGDTTVDGFLPPWELAKAYAFHVVLATIAEELGTPAHELVGQAVNDYIAANVFLKGGGHPSRVAIAVAIKRCQDPEWYPGKVSAQREKAGRKPVYSEHRKNEVARVAMELKRQLVRPTPRRVRARLPELTRNPETGKAMDKKTFHAIFSTRCYDEHEDDPWMYLESPAQDVLPALLKQPRVTCAKHILRHFAANAWYSHISIDPCYVLLTTTLERQEEQLIRAMGRKKWMSPGSARKGANLRAPATAKTQGGSNVTRVDWTPIFARGKVRIYVCCPEAAKQDPTLPAKLTDSQNLAKFIRRVLPDELAKMKAKYRWPDLPRVVVHDKVSYMLPGRTSG